MSYYITENKRTITNGHESMQIGIGLSTPTSKELRFAEKMCRALNGTYSEGINPLSVADVKNALETTIRRLNSYWDDISTGKMGSSNFKNAFIKEGTAALEKSKKL